MRTRTTERGFHIKRKWHYPRTYCCADFSFYYGRNAADAHKKRVMCVCVCVRLGRNRAKTEKSRAERKYICVCLCDTSRRGNCGRSRVQDEEELLEPALLTWRLQFMCVPLKNSHTPHTTPHRTHTLAKPSSLIVSGIVFGAI